MCEIVASDALVAHKTLPIYRFIIRATVLSKQSDFSTRFARRGSRQIIVYLTNFFEKYNLFR